MSVHFIRSTHLQRYKHAALTLCVLLGLCISTVQLMPWAHLSLLPSDICTTRTDPATSNSNTETNDLHTACNVCVAGNTALSNHITPTSATPTTHGEPAGLGLAVPTIKRFGHAQAQGPPNFGYFITAKAA